MFVLSLLVIYVELKIQKRQYNYKNERKFRIWCIFSWKYRNRLAIDNVQELQMLNIENFRKFRRFHKRVETRYC